MTLSERYSLVLDWFRKNMSVAESELQFNNPFELVVAVVLSAQCTDKRVNIVTKELFAIYPTPQLMSNASFDEIYSLIKSISYPNNKAKHLMGLSQVLVHDFNSIVPNDIDLLQKLPGVGRKTANVVLAVAFNKPAMPVDTHVFRVAHRIGLVPKSADTPLKVEQKLIKNIPQSELSIAHHWLLLHGRYTCIARKPKCNECGINSYCKYKS